jgi:SNF2 family DNA or RNA helicase
MDQPLFPHQLDGAVRIAAGTPTYLGYDMGIGKTRTFIEAVKMRRAKRVLVICPASAVLVWQKEIAQWHPGAVANVVKSQMALLRPATYYIVSHGLMSRREGLLTDFLVKGPGFEMTAIDEAHAFNAADTLRVKALRKAAPKLGDITPLSGTPMKNHAGDLYTLTALCWPQGLSLGRPMSRAEFEELFCRVTHKSFGGSRMIRVIEGSKNLDKLGTMLAPFLLRVRKKDVFKDLPPIIWDSVPVPLDATHFSTEDAKKLERFVDVLTHDELPSETPDDTLIAAMRVMSNNTALMSLRRMLGVAKLRGACDYIVDMLDNLDDDRKVLVFAHHAHVIAALARHLGEYSPAVLVGSHSATERKAAVDKFLTDKACRVFVGNIQAAGTAITLVGPTCKCSDVVFVESSWTPMDNAQAACRVHRIGQKDGVVVRMLSASGTLDDAINALLVRKAREFTQLFDAANT